MPSSVFERFQTAPAASGLYDPSRDRDACGLAMVATLRGTPGHDIVDTALNALRNLEHRGAVGSDAGTGDGAGILTQIPDTFFRSIVSFELPAPGTYAAGLVFAETDIELTAVQANFANLAEEEGLRVIGWREVPTNPAVLGDLVSAAKRHVIGGPGLADSAHANLPTLPISRITTSYQIALEVKDQPGVLAEVANIFAQHNVSVETVEQSIANKRSNPTAQLLIGTHDAKDSALTAVVQALSTSNVVDSITSVIRVEGN